MRDRNGLLQLVVPRRCPLCDDILADPGKLLCDACGKRLPRIKGPRCLKCSRPVEDERQAYCPGCAGAVHTFDRAYAAFVYEKEIRQSVLKMKFENRREFMDFYALAMHRAGRTFLAAQQPEAILPVPMYPKKVRRRGYDPCRIMARRLSDLTGLPLMADNLVRTRDTLPQKGLQADQRRKNLQGAFAVRSPEALPKSVLIVDDIYTTGSTVDEIGRVLRLPGAGRIISVLTLCIAR